MDVVSENEPSHSHTKIGVQVVRDWCRDQATPTTDTPLFPVTTSPQRNFGTSFSLFRSIYSHKKYSPCKMMFSYNQACRGSVITHKARFHALLNHHILFYSRSRCCSIHITEGLVNKSTINMTTEREQKQYKLNNSELMDLLSTMKETSTIIVDVFNNFICYQCTVLNFLLSSITELLHKFLQ
jgi:hypothetical protein